MNQNNDIHTKNLQENQCKNEEIASKYESILLTDSKPASTMKAEYLSPNTYGVERKDIPRRRALYKNKVIQEIIEEIEREKQIPEPIEDYCTTYDDMFRIPGFKIPEKTPENTELHLKYPLYNSLPLSIWSEKVLKENKNVVKLEGMTKIKDISSPFKKNISFTKSIHERFDDSEN